MCVSFPAPSNLWAPHQAHQVREILDMRVCALQVEGHGASHGVQKQELTQVHHNGPVRTRLFC